MKRFETKWKLEGRSSVISIRCLMHANNRHHSIWALQGNP